MQKEDKKLLLRMLKAATRLPINALPEQWEAKLAKLRAIQGESRYASLKVDYAAQIAGFETLVRFTESMSRSARQLWDSINNEVRVDTGRPAPRRRVDSLYRAISKRGIVREG